MDADEFRERGKEAVEYVADYLTTMSDRPVMSTVKPGYLQKLIPEEAPEYPEEWKAVFQDVETVILPGICHTQSANFHAYYPSISSFPSICADIFSTGFNSFGALWHAGPAHPELEVAMLDWFAKMINLPSTFLSGETGGGIIQGSASEAMMVAMLTARTQTLNVCQKQAATTPWLLRCLCSSRTALAHLVCYTSEEAHSMVEKNCRLLGIRCHKVATDDALSMHGESLNIAITEDKARGLVPFFVVATLGTTATCAIDDLKGIGKTCSEHNVWLHVDAAYAGSACICPEFRYLLNGVEYVDSFCLNAYKMLPIAFPSTYLWYKDIIPVIETFGNNPSYMKSPCMEKGVDYKDWEVHLGRPFRSLRLWFVIRMYGVSGLQAIVRKIVQLAKAFEALVLEDSRFEVTNKVILGLVCFRIKGSKEKNEMLLKSIQSDNRIFLSSAEAKGGYTLRFVICTPATTLDNVRFAWRVIAELAEPLLEKNTSSNGRLESETGTSLVQPETHEIKRQ